MDVGTVVLGRPHPSSLENRPIGMSSYDAVAGVEWYIDKGSGDVDRVGRKLEGHSIMSPPRSCSVTPPMATEKVDARRSISPP